MKKAVCLMIATLGLSGCYFSASTSSLEPVSGTPTITFSKTNTIETVSGGTRYEITPISGYKVRHSVGALFSKQVATTPQGFKVYSQVQGRISAEEDKQ